MCIRDRHKAKQLEKELHKSGKLFRIPTMNGIIAVSYTHLWAKYSDSEYLINKLNKITPYEIKFRRNPCKLSLIHIL